MTERVVVLPSSHRDALGHVRALPGLRVGTATDGELWLRGLPPTGELPVAVRALPASATYLLDAQDRLFPTGSLTPIATLPALAWLPIAEFWPLELPTAALPAQRPPRHRVRLVASARAEAGAGLVCTLEAWHAYAETAPEIRLRGLRFAVSDEGRVLLLGSPLPPVPGHELWQQAGLLLPAGYDFETPLLASLLARRLGTGADVLVLLGVDGVWEQILIDQLVPATRSAVRLTVQSFHNG